MTRRFVAGVAMMLALVSGCASRGPAPMRAGSPVFAVGDCVSIPSTAPDPLKAGLVDCGDDPSYTVGAVADAAGACPSVEYQHLTTQFADPATARLCLVPNLVAKHCYVLDVPIGVVHKADCTARGQQGLLVQVTERLDVHDRQACRSVAGQYAWPYPSPARTYCTLTVV